MVRRATGTPAAARRCYRRAASDALRGDIHAVRRVAVKTMSPGPRRSAARGGCGRSARMAAAAPRAPCAAPGRPRRPPAPPAPSASATAPATRRSDTCTSSTIGNSRSRTSATTATSTALITASPSYQRHSPAYCPIILPEKRRNRKPGMNRKDAKSAEAAKKTREKIGDASHILFLPLALFASLRFSRFLPVPVSSRRGL